MEKQSGRYDGGRRTSGAANGFAAGPGRLGSLVSHAGVIFCGSGGNLEAHLSEKRAKIVRDALIEAVELAAFFLR
jgi:hypothetical protein